VIFYPAIAVAIGARRATRMPAAPTSAGPSGEPTSIRLPGE
jgi:hypothetical protein